jgi:phage terminase large subunit
LHTTYKDNKFLDPEAIKVLEGFKETDPYFYQVYALGEWGVIGKTIFNAQIVNGRIAALRGQQTKRGYFLFQKQHDKILDDSIRWVDDENGYIRLYEPPRKRVPYVIGGDTAGEGSDYFSAHVLDNVTGKQVAVFHNELDEDLYTEQVYCLGKYYNEALIGIETNFSTYPVKQLVNLGYRKLYVREVPDVYTGKLQPKYGFQTNKLTRPLIIANLVKLVREQADLLMDIPTLDEMLTFVRNERGKPEAQEGKHDDLIMGLAIAHYVREQQSMEMAEQIIEQKELPFPFHTTEREVDFIEW